MQIKPYGYFESFLKRAILTFEHQTWGNSLTTVLDTCNLDLDAMLQIFIYMLCLHVLIVFFWYFRENWNMKYKTKIG